MQKPASLRTHLTAALPELAREPDALALYVTKGTLALRDGDNLGFEYRYTVDIVLLNYRGDPAQIMLPLALWIRANQRELIQNHQTGVDGITFEVDPVDNQAVDVQISLPLSEAIDILADDADRYQASFRAEPPMPDLEPMTDPVALLRQIYAPGGPLKELLAGYEGG